MTIGGQDLRLNLPPELAPFAALFDAPSGPILVALRYCLALAMVEAGQARLVETVSGEQLPDCIFETTTGQRFNVARPLLSEPTRALLMEAIQEVWEGK